MYHFAFAKLRVDIWRSGQDFPSCLPMRMGYRFAARLCWFNVGIEQQKSSSLVPSFQSGKNSFSSYSYHFSLTTVGTDTMTSWLHNPSYLTVKIGASLAALVFWTFKVWIQQQQSIHWVPPFRNDENIWPDLGQLPEEDDNCRPTWALSRTFQSVIIALRSPSNFMATTWGFIKSKTWK